MWNVKLNIKAYACTVTTRSSCCKTYTGLEGFCSSVVTFSAYHTYYHSLHVFWRCLHVCRCRDDRYVAWINEDVMMAGYASMTGLTMAFPLLFRILFRFPTRELLLFSAGLFIICDYVCMVCDFLPLVVLLSFVSGFFKIVGTFVCWSNIQLKITPKRNFAIFFPFLFTFVLGSVQLVNIATGYSIYAFDWQAMHRITIGAFILVFALVYFCMRHNYRQGPYIPFKGIDYLGGIMWTFWLFCIIFICVYGEHYDWLYGKQIRVAIVFALVLLVMCLQRAATIRHPYINLKTFSQRNMLYIFILFGCMTLMSATATSTQNIFTSVLLGYDARHNADLNWTSVRYNHLMQ